jgi:CubicO group peptidase (beta-lactamase class C family)
VARGQSARNLQRSALIAASLAHQAGLFAFDEPVDRSVVADLDRLAEVMARHRPAWEPGTRQAYHGLTLGFYEGELMRRSPPSLIKMLIGFRPMRLLVEGLNPRSNISRALALNSSTSIYLDKSCVYSRNLEVPAGGGVGTARSSGSPGTGGPLGFADPDAGIGYGYVTSQMGTVFTGAPRDVALRDALYAALRSLPRQRVGLERIAS